MKSPSSAPSRRDFAAASLGVTVGLGFPRITVATPAETPKQVILVALCGGLSHHDTLDLKPDAPAEIRGEFNPVPTAVPGIQICEHLPHLAKRMKDWALVRSLSHNENGHLPAVHRLLTGSTMPNQRGTDLDNVLSRRDWPCYAAGLNTVRPRTDGIPNGVTLPHGLIEGPLTWPGQHGGFLGPAHDPLLVTQDPNAPSFRMDAFALPVGNDPARMAQRQTLLDRLGHGPVGDPNYVGHQKRAFELLSTGRVSNAFDMTRESDKVRDSYGRNQFGQSLLLARRLVEAGVPIVQANMGIVQTWDTHTDNWGKLKTRLLPWLDTGLAALVDDLKASGRWATTLVAVLGEFGRTPKISTLPDQKLPGRDHWAACYSGLFAGGGVAGGRVIGASDKIGARPVTVSYTPYDIGATVYRALGVDPETEIRDTLGRPMRICSGTPMDVLFRNT